MLRPSVSRLTDEGSVGTREVVSISWPLLVTSIASFGVGTGVDLWVVGHFRPASDVALYGAAYRLVFFVATGFIIVSQVVPPIIAELHARGEKRELENALRSISTLAGIPAILVLVVFLAAGPFVMELVYGPFFRQGATVLAILSCARLVAVCTGSSGAQRDASASPASPLSRPSSSPALTPRPTCNSRPPPPFAAGSRSPTPPWPTTSGGSGSPLDCWPRRRC